MSLAISGQCGWAAEQLTSELGFDCHDVNPVVSFHNPFALASWTMPILELVIIAGAVWALVHAVRRLRQGDPTNIALWCASLVYLFVTEPPLYFPEWFGLDKQYGFIFSHNIFSVQFMYDRLPLYILCFYPAFSQMAYEVVRGLGIFRTRGAVQGAFAVAFVCQVFYEIFDMVGPQLKWWAWNPGNIQVNEPSLASVPMNSMLLFASVSFGVLTWLVIKLVGPKADGSPRSGRSIASRTLLAGVLTPPAMVLGGLPSAIFGGHTPNVTAQAWVIGIELAVVWLAGIWIVATQVRSGRVGGKEGVGDLSPFARLYPPAYLLALIVAWIGALPAFVAASNGFTSGGTPIGSWWYASACFLAALGVLAAVHLSHRRATPTIPAIATGV